MNVKVWSRSTLWKECLCTYFAPTMHHILLKSLCFKVSVTIAMCLIALHSCILSNEQADFSMGWFSVLCHLLQSLKFTYLPVWPRNALPHGGMLPTCTDPVCYSHSAKNRLLLVSNMADMFLPPIFLLPRGRRNDSYTMQTRVALYLRDYC